MRIARALAFIAAWAAAAAQPAELRLGATHTLQDSGILAVLVAAYERSAGTRVRALVAGTGQVMRYAENGDVDVVFTHSRADEERLIARGIGKARIDAMHNDFVLAGPAADPARIRGMEDAAAALARVREAGARFVSRGDESGTHRKEQQLWREAGGWRAWGGYRSAGVGAGRTVMMAHELEAYVLIDRATHRRLAARFPLAILVSGDPRLVNAYGVTTLRAGPGRAVDERAGDRFAAWIASPQAHALISGYRIAGEAVYKPGAPP